MKTPHPLSSLTLFDPDLARRLEHVLDQVDHPLSSEGIERMVDDILWSYSQEVHFGEAVSAGYMELAASMPPEVLAGYGEHIRSFGAHGPARGSIVAAHLVPVLKTGLPELERRFFDALEALLTKGNYLLNEPLTGLDDLLSIPDADAAIDYLGLLCGTFSQPLSYSRCLQLGRLLPQAVRAMPDRRRPYQLRELRCLVLADIAFAEPFLEGIRDGLGFLNETALHRFVNTALERSTASRQSAIRFLSLESRSARDLCSELQVTVPIGQVQNGLSRYLRARTGRPAAIKSLSDLGRSQKAGPCTDGKAIYLPDEIDHFPFRSENAFLYRCLTKLESGFLEFETFAFDLEKALALCNRTGLTTVSPKTPVRSDLEAFFDGFPCPGLAADLFTVFENGRVRRYFESRYPGLARTAYRPFIEETGRVTGHPLLALYRVIGLGQQVDDLPSAEDEIRSLAEELNRRFEAEKPEHMPVEASAVLTAGTYPAVARYVNLPATGAYESLKLPFDRQLRPDLFFTAHQDLYHRVDRLRERLKARGLDLHRTDLVQRMIDKGGSLSQEDIRRALKPGPAETSDAMMPGDLLAENILKTELEAMDAHEDPSRIHWLREWSRDIGDYLDQHVRVCDRDLEDSDSRFYSETLARRPGLVSRVRYAFELLKPEGLKRLRRWVEGDEFDYRELIDFILDRRAGLLPSDRLYIKRIKQTREVSVLVLVDLSRSTSNLVDEVAGTSVLDVEKEAIVLLSMALEVVGDSYAIAGFSGNGRLGVDYYQVKNFEELLSNMVRARISAMSPKRSTRLGAAIRRANLELESAESKVRLLILLSDGFPNDVDYKKTYAIEDTRKAIAEGRANGISFHGITVNLPGHPGLDDLYGSAGHTVISDIRELPDSLLRLYSALTRY